MPKKRDAHKCDRDALFKKLLPQCTDRAMNQLAPVVGRHNPDPRRQRRLYLFDLFLDPADDLQRVLTVPHDHNAPDGFSSTIEFCDAAAQIRSNMNGPDISQVNRDAVLNLQNDGLKVFDVLQVPQPPDKEFRSRRFESFSAGVLIALPDGVDDLGNRYLVG